MVKSAAQLLYSPYLFFYEYLIKDRAFVPAATCLLLLLLPDEPGAGAAGAGGESRLQLQLHLLPPLTPHQPPQHQAGLAPRLALLPAIQVASQSQTLDPCTCSIQPQHPASILQANHPLTLPTASLPAPQCCRAVVAGRAPRTAARPGQACCPSSTAGGTADSVSHCATRYSDIPYRLQSIQRYNEELFS